MTESRTTLPSSAGRASHTPSLVGNSNRIHPSAPLTSVLTSVASGGSRFAQPRKAITMPTKGSSIQCRGRRGRGQATRHTILSCSMRKISSFLIRGASLSVNFEL